MSVLYRFNYKFQYLYKKRYSHDEDIIYGIPSIILHICNVWTCIPLSACTHYTLRGLEASSRLPRCVVLLRLCITCNSSCTHQIKPEYYGGNIYVSIEGIILEHFISKNQWTPPSSSQSRTRHAVFHSFLYDNSTQDSSTTVAHRKLIIEL